MGVASAPHINDMPGTYLPASNNTEVPSTSNTTSLLDKELLEAAYRSNVRKRTRATIGVATSAGLAGAGLWYMAVPAAVAGYGLDKAIVARGQLEEIMTEYGVKLRVRDKVSGVVVGSAEKLTLSFLLLGHDELAYLGTSYGLDPDILAAHEAVLTVGNNGVLEAGEASHVLAPGEAPVHLGLFGWGNDMYNGVVDNIKNTYDVHGGALQTAAQVQGTVIAGAAAGSIEYMTNRIGHVGDSLSSKKQQILSASRVWEKRMNKKLCA